MSVPDVLAHPIRWRLVEYLLDADGYARGSHSVVNELARFKAEIGYGGIDEVGLDAVRRELEEEHLPDMLRRNVLATASGDGAEVEEFRLVAPAALLVEALAEAKGLAPPERYD